MDVLPSVVVPAVIGGVCWLVSWRLWNRREPNEEGKWGGATAFALGFFAGHVLLAGWPAFPGNKAQDWLPYLGLVGATLGVAERYWGGSNFARVPVTLLMSAAVVGIVLRNRILNDWEGLSRWSWLIGLTVGIAIVWNALERVARNNPGVSVPLALWVWTVGISAACVFSASALLGQLAGTLAAVCGAAVVLALWSPKLSLGGGAISTLVPLASGILLQAYFFAEMSVWVILALLAAPVFLLYGERRSIVYASKSKRTMVRLALVAVPVLTAVGIAYAGYSPPNATGAYDYYEDSDSE